MGSLPRLLFALAIVLVPAVIWATSAGLPERVATHFGSGGHANGWMARDDYRAFMLLMTTALPLVVAALTGFVPRIAITQIKLPDRAHWLSPARRDETLAWLVDHACWLGMIIAGFLLGLHLLTVEANERVPARLAEPAMFAVLGAFLLALALWIVGIARRFRRGA